MNWLPDSIYTICGENTQSCTNCSNVVYSPVVNGMVHDTQRGKVFCPFGTNDSMNKMIYGDQKVLNDSKDLNWDKTTWGRKKLVVQIQYI